MKQKHDDGGSAYPVYDDEQHYPIDFGMTLFDYLMARGHDEDEAGSIIATKRRRERENNEEDERQREAPHNFQPAGACGDSAPCGFCGRPKDDDRHS